MYGQEEFVTRTPRSKEHSMRKRLIVLAATIVMTMALPGTAMAGYGKTIKDGCGASYGQLVSTARASGHVTGSVGGAANFVTSGLAAAHGCNV
jgi:hypothetical protein